MIRNVPGQNAGSVYQNNSQGSPKTKEASSTQEQKAPSKVEALKAAIDSGEYKVDLDKLAHKMAEALL